ncbi:MAG: TerB family tellurite resistance protein [Adhaeribacter sp.]
MGLFDKLFNSAQAQITYSPKSEQEAWIAVMYGCIAVDGDVSDAEINKLTQTVVFKTLFNNHKIVDSYRTAMSMHKQIGSKQLIDSSVSKVSPDNKPTLFALALELLLADGILEDKEKEIIEYLATALNLDTELAGKIIEVTLIKNKGNAIL